MLAGTANVGISSTRGSSLPEFLVFVLFIFLGIGFLFFMRGDCIQAIVLEKSCVTDIRAATVVDLIYAILL